MQTPVDPEPTDELIAGVVVMSVDGQRPASSRIRLEPGAHQLRLLSRLDTPAGSTQPVDFELVAEACKRYELGARHPSRFNPRFDVVITSVRDEPGCSPGDD